MENVCTEKMSYSQLMTRLCATSGWMPRASNEVNFKAPIQPITTTRP